MIDDPLPVFKTIEALRDQVRAWRAAGETVALIPTMGALHRGHLALVEEGRRRCHRTVTSIFVNPMQFAPTEDFAAYPRTFESDLRKLADVGCDGCFAPTATEMYPPDFSVVVSLNGPAKADLEDRFRPTHFAGVATVVAKLLNQAQADVAVFGEKDYQQLLVIRAMARDLDIPTEIAGLETVRESDGLALSSRNVYLTPQERIVAARLNQALRACEAEIVQGTCIAHSLATARAQISDAGFAIDYCEARDANTLAPLAAGHVGPIRLLVAAKIGRTRLIDNIGVAR